MNLRKPLLIAGVVGGVGLAGLSAGGMASAATNAQEDDNPASSLISRLATTFNLDEAKVEEVFEAERTEREAEHKQQLDTTLSQAVKDGKLTEAQKSAILQKRDELKNEREQNREAMQDKSDEERKAAMESRRTELQQWAESEGIPEEYQRYVMGGHKGHGGPGMRPEKPSDD